jgi:acyl-CoA synthetase (AMP-forming)/AMP-acid ligase II
MPALATLTALLSTAADTSTALAAPGRADLNFGALRSHMARTITHLNTLGIGRHDRVAIVLPNGPGMASAFIGITVGSTAAPLNPGYRSGEFEFYLSDLNARALVGSVRELGRVTGILTPSIDAVYALAALLARTLPDPRGSPGPAR